MPARLRGLNRRERLKIMDEFSQQLQDIALGHAAIAKAGIEAGERAAIPYRNALRLIVEVAERYPDAQLPTPLLCAIVAAKAAL